MSYNHQAVLILLFIAFICLFSSTNTEYLYARPWKGTTENEADKQPCPHGVALGLHLFYNLPLCSLCTCIWIKATEAEEASAGHDPPCLSCVHLIAGK